jgi:hypothetical protein
MNWRYEWVTDLDADVYDVLVEELLTQIPDPE